MQQPLANQVRAIALVAVMFAPTIAHAGPMEDAILDGMTVARRLSGGV